MIRHISLRLHLSIIILFLVLTEGIIIGYLSFYHAKQLAIEGKKREVKDTVNRIDISMNIKTRFLMDSLEDWVEEKKPIIFGENIREYQQEIEEYKQYIKNIIGSDSSVIIVDLNRASVLYGGEYLGQEDIKEIDTELAAKRYHIVWFGKVSYVFRGQSTDFIRLVKPVFWKNRYTGFVVLDVETDMIGNLLGSNRSLYDYQYIFTLDREKNVISTFTGIEEDLYRHVAERFDKGEREFRLEYNGNMYYVAGQYNGITGWVNYEMVREVTLFPNAKRLVENIAIVVILSIFITGVFICFFTYILLKPLGQLSEAMGKVCTGDFSIRLKPISNHEIAGIMLSFNFMIDKINKLIHEVYYEKLAKKEAELKALQAQINPHFLYNTLDAINWMLIEKNEFEISDCIVSVGCIIRYCIDDSKTYVPIYEELEYIKAYLNLQKNRLEERLEFDITVEERLDSVEIPKLILQPLVENAIIHGIEPLKRTGLVKVHITRREDCIVFQIEDNGAGIQEDILKDIFDEKPLIKNHKNRIGVKNILKRLRLYYKDTYDFRIYTDMDKGTNIEMVLPMRREI